ncbi:unnamed protein product, partial [Urochloa humidicola]
SPFWICPASWGVAHETGGVGGPSVAAFGGHGEVASPAGENAAVLGTPQPRSRAPLALSLTYCLLHIKCFFV